jgi:hypothetical protein
MRHCGILTLFVAVSALQAPCFAADGKAALVVFSNPAYPKAAQLAHIWGEVWVEVTVHPDGKSEAVAPYGHQMLKEAALQSANASKFTCAGCADSAKYLIAYSFVQVDGTDCCNASAAPVKVTIEDETTNAQGNPQTRVVIAAESNCLCDPTESAIQVKVRSAKCLYLWRCSTKSVESEP